MAGDLNQLLSGMILQVGGRLALMQSRLHDMSALVKAFFWGKFWLVWC